MATSLNANLVHIFTDADAAVAAANAHLADTNAADYLGTPVASYRIFAVEGLYGDTFEVVYEYPFNAEAMDALFDTSFAMAA